MQIIYLHHSGFVVECENVNLVFDAISPIPESVFNSDKPVLLFVSHSHGDHYSRSIWDYKNKNITYIISSDIFRLPKKDKVLRISEGDEIEIDQVKVKAFGSTDQGVSFLIETKDNTIFFAGDLNWWAWDPKTRPHINPKVEEDDYKRILGELKQYLGAKQIDLAFIPVDPRLDLPGGELWAAQYFIKEFSPKELVPMHFWGDYKVIDRLKKSLPLETTTKIGTMSSDNQVVKF